MTENIMPRMNKNKFIYIIILLILIGISVFFFLQYKSVKDSNINPNKELKEVTEQASRIYDLPKGKATLITVESTKEFAGQEFFSDAEIGDKILIYTSAQQAIIYRPSTNKLVNVGPISISNKETKTSDTSSTTTPTSAVPPLSNCVSVDIIARNNNSDKTTARLNTDYSGKVTTKQISSDVAISKTIIVVNNETSKELASEIATTLKGQVGETPEGLPTSTADIVVYVIS